MKPWLVVAALLALTATARAECYVSEENPMDTLTEGETKLGYGFVWERGGKTIELSTGEIGTGMIARKPASFKRQSAHLSVCQGRADLRYGPLRRRLRRRFEGCGLAARAGRLRRAGGHEDL